MPPPLKRLKQFILSQYFYDGLKITFGVMLPAVIFYQLDLLETGITISLGALYVSLTDNPGPVQHKRNAMLAANICNLLVALIIGFTNKHVLLLSILIPLLCFFFSMLTVYGARASAVGISALLIMITGIDHKLDTLQTLLHAGYLFSGGLWYALFSQSLYQVIPFRPAEQTLGECIQEVAEYIKLKAAFYEVEANDNEHYAALINQQVKVNEQFENVREILFRTRRLLKDASPQGNALHITFINVVDLFEQSMESYYDYAHLRETYGHTGILEKFRLTILKLSEELNHIGISIHNHETADALPDTETLLSKMKMELAKLDDQGINTLVLKKIFVNLRHVAQRIRQINEYQVKSPQISSSRKRDFDSFVSPQSWSWKLFRDNLTFSSSVFRHALRVSLICLAAFLFARIVYTGHHSYWILLTIIVILKPGFSQSKQRNYERIIGTVAGGLVGIGILLTVKDVNARFGLLLLFMLLSYSFVRLRYAIGVLFMTPFVLILFSFIGDNSDMFIVRERIMDTLIGASIAGVASYFVFPIWEYTRMRSMMSDLLLHHMNYLLEALRFKPHDQSNRYAYRLARKQFYVSVSNLASAFQRMLSEPKNKRQYVQEVNKFIVLNTIFSASLAALSTHIRQQGGVDEIQLKQLRSTLNLLKEAYTAISGKELQQEIDITPLPNVSFGEDELLARMQNTAADLKKLCTQVSF